MANREQRSTKLRHTERIAELAGFAYDRTKNRYGGYFTAFQLEQILLKLEVQNNKIACLETEIQATAKAGAETG